MTDAAKVRRAHHEAAHAIIAELLCNRDQRGDDWAEIVDMLTVN